MSGQLPPHASESRVPRRPDPTRRSRPGQRPPAVGVDLAREVEQPPSDDVPAVGEIAVALCLDELRFCEHAAAASDFPCSRWRSCAGIHAGPAPSSARYSRIRSSTCCIQFPCYLIGLGSSFSVRSLTFMTQVISVKIPGQVKHEPTGYRIQGHPPSFLAPTAIVEHERSSGPRPRGGPRGGGRQPPCVAQGL